MNNVSYIVPHIKRNMDPPVKNLYSCASLIVYIILDDVYTLYWLYYIIVVTTKQNSFSKKKKILKIYVYTVYTYSTI